MKIVNLNECFLSEEDIKILRTLGEVEIFTDTDSEQKAIERVKDADIIIADPFVVTLNENVINAANKAKLIAVSVTGTDLIDKNATKKLGIQIAHIPGFSTQAVAEMTIGLIFCVCRNIVLGDKRMREKPFYIDAGNQKDKPFHGIELAGKTLGIIGLGKIGQRVAQLATSLGMKVIAFDRLQKNIDNIKQVSLEELLKNSDIISLHLGFADELRHFISEPQFALMKDGVILINTANEKLINEEALYIALTNGKVTRAGLDLLENWKQDNPILKLGNVVVTPNIGFLTDGSIKNIPEMVVKNIQAFVEGKPQNIVN